MTRGKGGGGKSRRQNITYTPNVPSFLREFMQKGEKRDAALSAQAAATARAIRHDCNVVPTKDELDRLQSDGFNVMQPLDETDVRVQSHQSQQDGKDGKDAKDGKCEIIDAEEREKKHGDDDIITSAKRQNDDKRGGLPVARAIVKSKPRPKHKAFAVRDNNKLSFATCEDDDSDSE